MTKIDPLQQAEAKLRWLSGASFSQIAKELGVTRQAVHAWAKKERWYFERERLIKELEDEGRLIVKEIQLRKLQAADFLSKKLLELLEGQKVPMVESVSDYVALVKGISQALQTLMRDFTVGEGEKDFKTIDFGELEEMWADLLKEDENQH